GNDAADDGGGPADGGSDAADDGDAMEAGASPVEGGSDAGEGGSAPVDGGCNASALTVSLEGLSVTTFQGIVTGVGPALPATVSSPAEQSAGGGASGGGGDSTGGSDSSGCACDVARRQDERAGFGAAMAAVFAVSLAGRRRRRGARGCG
ncbi:MAG: hypothetical protein WBY94_02870, partial [Polyangiaceae bacterium]